MPDGADEGAESGRKFTGQCLGSLGVRWEI
jgi:hypothetical protein